MLGLLCLAAVPAQLFLPPAAMPRHAAPGTLRAPAAVADLSTVKGDALMQQLQAQLKGAVGKVGKEADGVGTLPHFLTVVTTGFAFLLAYAATPMWMWMRMWTTGRAEDPGTPPSRRAGSPLRMSASDPERFPSDSDYSALSRAIWRESENTKQRVRTGPAAAVLSHAPAAYVVIFNKGTEDEGVYTLQSQVDPRKQHLLTFENSGDADRFANLLQGQGLDQLGKPLMWESWRIVEYCEACEYAVTLVPMGTVFTPPQTNEMDHEAFRAQELMRQEAEFQGADFMQTAAKQKRDDHALGLHLYKAERENLERLFGL